MPSISPRYTPRIQIARSPRGDIRAIGGENARSVRIATLSSGTCLLKRGRRYFRLHEENQRSDGDCLEFHSYTGRNPSVSSAAATYIEPRRDLYLFALVRVDMSMRICTAAFGLSPGKKSPILENWKVIENYGAPSAFPSLFYDL